jgi:hypothetical protein
MPSSLFLLRSFALSNVFLLFLSIIHKIKTSKYSETMDMFVKDEQNNRLQWERYLKKYRELSARKVSNEMQILFAERRNKESMRCEKEFYKKCERFERCRSKKKKKIEKKSSSKSNSSSNDDDDDDDVVQAMGKEIVSNGDDLEIEGTEIGEVGIEESRKEERRDYFDAMKSGEAGPASAFVEKTENEGVSFKIFVYNLPPKFHVEMLKKNKRCVTDQYGTEIRIHANIMQSKMYTIDPLEAEFFYVPVYGECKLFENIATLGAKKGLQETNSWWLEAMTIVTDQYPFWNRTQGRDHVFTFAGARGPHIFKDWKKHIKKSIFLTPEGDRSLSEQFNTWKDVVIPGLEPEKAFWSGSLRKQKEVKRAKTFAYFRGTIANKLGKQYSKGIRIKMKEAFKDIKDVVFTEQHSSCDKVCYREEMRASTFCLCPRGWSPWTLRAYQALMVGCIPVIIADEIEFPYENSFDWRTVSIKIPESRHAETIDILRSIDADEIARKLVAIEKFWPSVAWKKPSDSIKGNDAFHSVMRELEVKRRPFKSSSLTFWN